MKNSANVESCVPIYYVSGPMRGYPEFNFPAFSVATERLRRDFGCEVFSPAERDLKEGFDPTGLDGSLDELVESFDLRDALACDCEFICRRATHIFMLSGWARSTGATAERALAIALGLTVEGAPA